uniref:RNA helicase n=1 Tax=Globodera pallida TaxID=36090 RepID=A0A183C2Y1_GLOPA
MCGWASYWTVYLLVHFDISEATKWFALSYIGFVMQLTLSLNGPILYALSSDYRTAFRAVLRIGKPSQPTKALFVVPAGPGTGKTFTAAAIMAAILKEDPSARVLALAPTNIAAVKLVMEMEGVLRVEVDSDLAFAEQNSSLFGGGLSYGHNGPRKLLITGYRRQLWAHLPLLPFTIRKKLDLDTIIENMDAALGVDAGPRRSRLTEQTSFKLPVNNCPHVLIHQADDAVQGEVSRSSSNPAQSDTAMRVLFRLRRETVIRCINRPIAGDRTTGTEDGDSSVGESEFTKE